VVFVLAVELAVSALPCQSAFAQDAKSTLITGPRTPESLDHEYPPTEASHEARRIRDYAAWLAAQSSSR